MRTRKKTDCRDDKQVRLTAKISIVEEKLTELASNLLDKRTGRRDEDALAVADTDRERAFYEKKLRELKLELKKCHESHITSDIGLAVGDFVKLLKAATRQVITVRLVDNVELYVGERCLSVDSPMGQALVGKKPGDFINITTPLGDQQYLIM
jgi:transcription elongation GreA/GreB family factor